MSESKMSALEIISELENAKSYIYSKMTEVKVHVDEKNDPDVIAAISGLFGDGYLNNGSAIIDFNMVTECMKILRLAGQGKAQELIK